MAHTKTFYSHSPHVTGMMAPAPVPERYPFHDQDDCALGQEIKAGGNWQYYEPVTKAETRVRCAHCAVLDTGRGTPQLATTDL